MKPKQVYFVALEGPHAPGASLRYGERGGGLFSQQAAAEDRKKRLENKGFSVGLYRSTIEWEKMDLG